MSYSNIVTCANLCSLTKVIEMTSEAMIRLQVYIVGGGHLCLCRVLVRVARLLSEATLLEGRGGEKKGNCEANAGHIEQLSC